MLGIAEEAKLRLPLRYPAFRPVLTVRAEGPRQFAVTHREERTGGSFAQGTRSEFVTFLIFRPFWGT